MARSSKTLAGSAPGWLVFVIMFRLPKFPSVAALAGLLIRLHLVAVERSLAMTIERRGANIALLDGFRATRRILEGAHALLTPSAVLLPQSESRLDVYRSVRTSS